MNQENLRRVDSMVESISVVDASSCSIPGQPPKHCIEPVDQSALKLANAEWKKSCNSILKKKSLDLKDMRIKLAKKIRFRRESRLLKRLKRDENLAATHGRFLRAMSLSSTASNYSYKNSRNSISGSRKGRPRGNVASVPTSLPNDQGKGVSSIVNTSSSFEGTTRMDIDGSTAVKEKEVSSPSFPTMSDEYRPLERVVSDPNPYNSLLTSLLLNSLRQKPVSRRRLKALAIQALHKIIGERKNSGNKTPRPSIKVARFESANSMKEPIKLVPATSITRRVPVLTSISSHVNCTNNDINNSSEKSSEKQSLNSSVPLHASVSEKSSEKQPLNSSEIVDCNKRYSNSSNISRLPGRPLTPTPEKSPQRMIEKEPEELDLNEMSNTTEKELATSIVQQSNDTNKHETAETTEKELATSIVQQSNDTNKTENILKPFAASANSFKVLTADLPAEGIDLVRKIDVWCDTFCAISLINTGAGLAGYGAGGSRNKRKWSRLDQMVYELTRVGEMEKLEKLAGKTQANSAYEWLWQYAEEWNTPWEALLMAERGHLHQIQRKFGTQIFKAAHKWVWARDDFWHPTPYVQLKAQQGNFKSICGRYHPDLKVDKSAYAWVWQRSLSWHAHLIHYRRLAGHPDVHELIDDEICSLDRKQDCLLANIDKHVESLLHLRRTRQMFMAREEALVRDLCKESKIDLGIPNEPINAGEPIRLRNLRSKPRGHVDPLIHNPKKRKRLSDDARSARDISDSNGRTGPFGFLPNRGNYRKTVSICDYKIPDIMTVTPSGTTTKTRTRSNSENTLNSLDIDGDNTDETDLWLEIKSKPVLWQDISAKFEVVKTKRDKPLGHHEEAIEGDFALIGAKKPKRKSGSKSSDTDRDLELFPVEGTDKEGWRDAGRGSFLRACQGMDRRVDTNELSDSSSHEEQEDADALTDEHYDKLHTLRLAYIKGTFDLESIRNRYNITAPMPKAARRGGNWHPGSNKGSDSIKGKSTKSKNSQKSKPKEKTKQKTKTKAKPKPKPKSKTQTNLKVKNKTTSTTVKKREGKVDIVSNTVESTSNAPVKKRRISGRNRSVAPTPKLTEKEPTARTSKRLRASKTKVATRASKRPKRGTSRKS